MHKHKSNKLENAIFVGVIVILLISIISLVGKDMNAKVVSEQPSIKSKTLFYIESVIITLGALLFVALSFNSLFSTSESSKDEEEKMHEFISQCAQRGYEKAEIMFLLAKHGWQEEDIDKYF